MVRRYYQQACDPHHLLSFRCLEVLLETLTYCSWLAPHSSCSALPLAFSWQGQKVAGAKICSAVQCNMEVVALPPM